MSPELFGSESSALPLIVPFTLNSYLRKCADAGVDATDDDTPLIETRTLICSPLLTSLTLSPGASSVNRVCSAAPAPSFSVPLTLLIVASFGFDIVSVNQRSNSILAEGRG